MAISGGTHVLVLSTTWTISYFLARHFSLTQCKHVVILFFVTQMLTFQSKAYVRSSLSNLEWFRENGHPHLKVYMKYNIFNFNDIHVIEHMNTSKMLFV